MRLINARDDNTTNNHPDRIAACADGSETKTILQKIHRPLWRVFFLPDMNDLIRHTHPQSLIDHAATQQNAASERHKLANSAMFEKRLV